MLAYYLKISLFLTVLFLLQVPFGIYILFSTLILFIVPQRYKITGLILLNVFHVIFIGEVFRDALYTSDRLISNLLKLEIELSAGSVYLARIFALISTFGLIFFLGKRVRSKNPLRIFWSLFFILVILFFLMLLFRSFPYLNLIMWATIVLYAKYFWIILYNLRRESFINYSDVRRGWADLILFPFWSNITNYHSHNMPRYIKDLEGDIFKDKNEAVNASFKTMFLSFICSILASILSTLTMSDVNRYKLTWLPISSFLNYVNAFEVGLKSFNDMRYSSIEIWFIILTHGVCFLLKNASMMYAIAAVIEFSGFRVASPIHHIQKANSFSDFMARYYYYYSDIIKTFFYYPLFIFIDQFSMKLWIKKFLSSFCAVFFGGFFIHFFIELAKYIKLDSVGEAFKYTVLLMPYLFLLSFFVGLSSCLPRAHKLGKFKFLWIFGFLLVYAVAYSTQVYRINIRAGLPVQIEDYFLFLKKLFLFS